MKYNPKAKLDTSQIKDRREEGGVRRRSASDDGPDGAARPASPQNAAAEEDFRRYSHLTYRDGYRPVGHNRGQKVSFPHGVPTTKADRPDGADGTKGHGMPSGSHVHKQEYGKPDKRRT